MDLYPEIKAIIAKLLAIEPAVVTKEAHLQFDLGADSLALLNLAGAISEKYGVELRDEDFAEMENVGQLVSIVESRYKKG